MKKPQYRFYNKLTIFSSHSIDGVVEDSNRFMKKLDCIVMHTDFSTMLFEGDILYFIKIEYNLKEEIKK